jgi:hypothetical protein
MPQFNESIELLNAAGITLQLNNLLADIIAGGNRTSGSIVLKNTEALNRISLEAGNADLRIGGNGATGDIFVLADNEPGKPEKVTIHIDGRFALIDIGGNGSEGDIRLFDERGQNRIRLDAGEGNMWIGGNGADGDIVLFKSTGDNSTLEQASIHLDGQSGNIRCNDIIIPGADFAEDFDIDPDVAILLEPGTVMVLGPDGKLVESTKAFDRKVAGVVSGAGKYRTGIILDKQPNSKGRWPIALSGKVMCKVDASFGAIEPGDLITTAPRKGFAMKANDPLQAFGAIIGKALAEFPSGTGLLPILVSLQ